MLKIEGYCICNPKTGLYSKGGYSPKWKKKPKIWSNIGHLKNHLNMFVNMDYTNNLIIIRNVYEDCFVYDLVTQEPHTSFNIKEFLLDVAKRQQIEYNGRYIHYKIVFK